MTGTVRELLPDVRFRGSVHCDRPRTWWHWIVHDLATGRAVAWGEEGSYAVALRECRQAVAGFRWFYIYARAERVHLNLEDYDL